MKRIRQLFDPYIALMLATVLLATVFPATGRGAAVAGTAADAGIVFLFFLYGARLSLIQAWEGVRHWKLQLAVLCCTFVLFPLLGLGISQFASADMPHALVSGFLFLCVLPSTVQSSIAFTSIARGNVPAALCAASASNIIGVFISPLLAGVLLGTVGNGISFAAYRDIGLQLLLPFVIGQLARPLIGGWIQRQKRLLGFADRGSILLIIYVAFSKGMEDDVWGQIDGKNFAILLVALAALLAVALVLTMLFAERVLRFAVEDQIVLQFCGSKKSLASGLPMASVLFGGPQLGMIVLPLMLFHQLQLIVCAVLARRYGARPD